MAYPELEMEKILELDVEKGTYAVTNDGIKKINFYKSIPKKSIFNNIVEL